jgi:hypothetical protein
MSYHETVSLKKGSRGVAIAEREKDHLCYHRRNPTAKKEDCKYFPPDTASGEEGIKNF